MCSNVDVFPFLYIIELTTQTTFIFRCWNIFLTTNHFFAVERNVITISNKFPLKDISPWSDAKFSESFVREYIVYSEITNANCKFKTRKKVFRNRKLQNICIRQPTQKFQFVRSQSTCYLRKRYILALESRSESVLNVVYIIENVMHHETAF